MNFKAAPVDFEQKWGPLKETVKSILRLDTIPRDIWHARFNDIYVLCGAFTEPHLDELYVSTKSLIETHVSNILPLIQTEDTENQLQNYCTHWQNYGKGIKFLESLYLYVFFLSSITY